MKKILIYTDGACSGNPGPGGWGSILMYEGHTKEVSGYMPQTTNNIMELTAVIEALKLLKFPCEVEIYSDSAYVINAFNNGWVDKWMRNGWKTGGGDSVKNIDLWKELISLSKTHIVKWIKVKGHSDNLYNNRCDEMARAEIKKNTN